MGWALRMTSAMALVAGLLSAQPAAAEPQVGAVGQREYLTGEIKNKQNVTLRTPTASMVICGTELVLLVPPDGTTEVDVESGGVDLFVCDRPDAVPVEAGQSFTVSPSCEGARGQARDRADVGYPIPRMPTQYAALEDIETAAGDETSDTPPPEWVRGRNGDHEPASDRGSNRD